VGQGRGGTSGSERGSVPDLDSGLFASFLHVSLKSPRSSSMKSVTSSSSWIPRSNRDKGSTQIQDPPLSPTYIAPRNAPRPPNAEATSAFKAGFNSVFRKPKAPSLHSAYSASTGTSSENQSIHPYSSAHMPPLPVVSSHNAPDDDDECPVCLEPLSFSFRLPGEKPHIVPECGHALHEVCNLIMEKLVLTILGLLHRCVRSTAKPSRKIHAPQN